MRTAWFVRPILVLATLCASGAAAQGTHTLHGKVVALDGRPVEGIRLRVRDYGDPDVLRSGEFTLEIPGGVESIAVESRDTAWSVVYPPDGRLPVPAGDEAAIIVVGEPAQRTVANALAEREREARLLLKQYGVQAERIGGVEQGIAEILRKLDLREEDLRNDVRRKERQTEDYPWIVSPVEQLVMDARNLQTTLRLLQPLIDKQPKQALEALDSAVTRYNRSYEYLRTRRDTFETAVERDWPDGKLARRDLADLFDNAIERTHRERILPLNELLRTVESKLMSGRRDAEYQAAMAELARGAAELDSALDDLERRKEQVLGRLRPA